MYVATQICYECVLDRHSQITNTWIPKPREPVWNSAARSMMRTRMPFFARQRADTSPAGPAPTFYARYVRALNPQSLNLQQELGSTRTW